jgi:hypothetical protein
MIIINRFERSCGTFKGGGGKNPTVANDIRLVCLEEKNYIYIFLNNNDHGVDVHIIMVI